MELIGWDVGVILSTQTRWIFEQQVEMHPGALAFYEHHKDWHSKGNENGQVCHKLDCPMQFMQQMLGEWFNGNKDRVCDFFTRVAALDIKVPSVYDIRGVLQGMGFTAEDEARIKGLTDAAAPDSVRQLIKLFEDAGFQVKIRPVTLDELLKDDDDPKTKH